MESLPTHTERGSPDLPLSKDAFLLHCQCHISVVYSKLQIEQLASHTSLETDIYLIW